MNFRRHAAAALLALASCGKPEIRPPAVPVEGAAVVIAGRTVPVELWRTERERRTTLYGLPRLEEGRGLLLAWPRERFIKIESESSPASYDLAFLDRSGRIVDLQELKEGDGEGNPSRVEAAWALILPKKTAALKAGETVALSAQVTAAAAAELPLLRIGGVAAHVELALSETDRQHGLMFRPKMSADDGMLFAYDDEASRTFWMMNTLLPLDIAFFAADGTLLNVNGTPIGENPRQEPVPRSPSAGNARYVLEMNLGWFRRKGLVGDDGKPKPGLKAEFPPEAVRGRFD